MLETLKMSPLGALHTIIGLIAIGAGFAELIRHKEISSSRSTGKLYIAATILTCFTAFGIFHHGGFGIGHVLAIITLTVLSVAIAAERTKLFGSLSRYVGAVSYSMTVLFHLIPAVNETATRLPLGAPIAKDADAPVLHVANGVLFAVFLMGAFLQVYWLRTAGQSPALDGGLDGHGQVSR